jgi:hypothetical protein
MYVTSFNYLIEVHVLLVPHVLNINILLLDHWRRFWIKHSPVPILMKESPKSFIGASLLR